MLTLELELLTGAYRAALPDGTGAEWPPHPERIYSALVQAWGDGGRDSTERDALEWLEALMPPVIHASPFSERDAPTVFVPPNDPRGTDITVLPERRPRQARTFAVAVPEDPVVRMVWDDAPDAATLDALGVLAQRVASVGHSSSLVRLAFDDVAHPQPALPAYQPSEAGDVAVRVTYGGRLEDLERWYSNDGGKPVERPRTLDIARYKLVTEEPAAAVVESVFGGPDQWFVFEDAGSSTGFRPDLLGFPHVARRLRDALMSVGAQPPAEIVSGHGAGDRPSERPHLAVLPLANVGWERSTGDLLGVAVVLPRAIVAEDRQRALQALASWVRVEDEVGRAQLHITKELTWSLERTAYPSRASLKPSRWCQASHTWASVTPVLLDRFPRTGDPREEAEILAASCTNIGLPEPVQIEIHKHSAIRGGPSCYPARGRSSRPDWSFPKGASFRDRVRRHIVLRFSQDVRGPVALGAGRYQGLGLCLPIGGGTRA